MTITMLNRVVMFYRVVKDGGDQRPVPLRRTTEHNRSEYKQYVGVLVKPKARTRAALLSWHVKWLPTKQPKNGPGNPTNHRLLFCAMTSKQLNILHQTQARQSSGARKTATPISTGEWPRYRHQMAGGRRSTTSRFIFLDYRNRTTLKSHRNGSSSAGERR